MKKTKHAAITALWLVVCALAALMPSKAKAYTPQYTNLKVGLNYADTALSSANLRNTNGGGYEFGYLDAQRVFVPLARTSVNAITMAKDRTVYYNPDAEFPEYVEGTSGSIIVGCFHIQLNAQYAAFDEAASAAQGYSSSFVKYDNGFFAVCIGNYTARSDAESAMAQMGLSGFVTAGTSSTISVIETGTGNIVFEYDGGSGMNLVVMPESADGVKSETWFRGYRYYGGFQYARPDGENLTVINIVDIEDYVKGVVQHEMSNAWPIEALKAQACCARTYAMANLHRHSSSGFDICTGEHCQVYGGRNGANETSDRAVTETAGMYITYDGALCQTYFSSSDGGATENVENVWRDALPYLRGVIDPYEADVASKIAGYKWKLTYTSEQLTQRLRKLNYNCAAIVSMTVTEYSPTGNVIRVALKDANGTTWNIAKRDNLNYALGVPSIRFTVGGATQPGSTGSICVNSSDNTLQDGMSSYFAVGGDGLVSALPSGEVFAVTGTEEVKVVAPDVEGGGGGSADGTVDGLFTIEGTGRGHNVGMSQWGAYSMAFYHNKTYLEILNFYFTGVVIG